MKVRITAKKTVYYSQVIEIEEEEFWEDAPGEMAEAHIDVHDVDRADDFDDCDCEVTVVEANAKAMPSEE